MQREDYEYYQSQSDLQKQQIEGGNAQYAPQIHEQIQQAQAVLVEQTNPKTIIKEMMLTLRGLEESADGTLVQVGESKMNEKGIRNIWVWAKSFINQGIILSHYEEHQIGSIMDALQEDLVDDLCLNWKEYGIKNKTDLDLINDLILVNIDAALKRALGQNEKNWLGKISIENISGAPHFAKPKKESFWNKFRL